MAAPGLFVEGLSKVLADALDYGIFLSPFLLQASWLPVLILC